MTFKMKIKDENFNHSHLKSLLILNVPLHKQSICTTKQSLIIFQVYIYHCEMAHSVIEFFCFKVLFIKSNRDVFIISNFMNILILIL